MAGLAPPWQSAVALAEARYSLIGIAMRFMPSYNTAEADSDVPRLLVDPFWPKPLCKIDGEGRGRRQCGI